MVTEVPSNLITVQRSVENLMAKIKQKEMMNAQQPLNNLNKGIHHHKMDSAALHHQANKMDMAAGHTNKMDMADMVHMNKAEMVHMNKMDMHHPANKMNLLHHNKMDSQG